jgi:hypothetical protein
MYLRCTGTDYDLNDVMTEVTDDEMERTLRHETTWTQQEHER